MNLKGFRIKRAEKTEQTVLSAKLPREFDGFKIAQISDPHSKPALGVFETISAEKPDITVITGDLLHDDDGDKSGVEELVSKLLSVSPVYFVTGNHDVWRKENRNELIKYEKMGAVFLDNDMQIIEKNGAEIAVFGVGDSGKKDMKKLREYIKSAFLHLPSFSGYKILLFHRANLFDEIKDYGYDLVLSGHMHGGQIAIWHLGGVLAPSSALFTGKRVIFPKYAQGVHTFGDTTMIVNRGIGNTMPIPRWGNPPEVGIITLKCGK